MRVLFMGNNWAGWKAMEYVRKQGDEVVGLVVHPHGYMPYKHELMVAAVAAGVRPERIFMGDRLRDPRVVKAIEALNPEIGLSVYFGYILKPGFIDLFPRGVINLHPGYLPYNRGAHPNVWSILDGTPAGVTLHYIDVGVDTGDVIAQREVAIEPADTGWTLYRKLEKECLSLFKETWPQIRSGHVTRTPQAVETGTSHRAKELDESGHIYLDQMYSGQELIDILRARTFPPHTGAYFVRDGRKTYLELTLLDEQD